MFEKLKNIILEINDEAVIEMDTNIIDDDVLDSMELVTFLVDIETEFGVEISADEFINNGLGSVESLLTYLEKGK
jgi:acyl carrier protein